MARSRGEKSVSVASRPAAPGGGEIQLPGIPLASHVEVREEYFSGPLPSPDALFGYDRALPGTANRIIALAEQEATHRHAMERQLVNIHGRNSMFGIVSAFVLGLAAILGGVYAAVHGADIAGAGVVLTALASLAGVFVVQRRSERAEAMAKQQA